MSHYWKSHVVAHMSFVALFDEDFCLSLVLCISLHVLTSLAIILLRACVCARVRVCVFIPLGFICWSVIVAVPGLRTCFCTDSTCVNWNIYTSRT